MTPRREATIEQLRALARTMTQSQAAASLGVNRQWVNQLAHEYGIRFRNQQSTRARRCRRCAYRLRDAPKCLRCKWTPARVRKLRERYGLSQIRMALEVIKMNVWACMRWENGRNRPAARALARLEDCERALDRKKAMT